MSALRISFGIFLGIFKISTILKIISLTKGALIHAPVVLLFISLITFESKKGRDNYLVHPDHKKFVEIVGPIIEDVFVVDYVADK